MREYLDSKSQKKVALLEKIFYAENHTSTQEELLNDLNITYPTLISTIKTINFDIERFGYKAFSIVHSAPNLSYTLKYRIIVVFNLLSTRILESRLNFKFSKLCCWLPSLIYKHWQKKYMFLILG